MTEGEINLLRKTTVKNCIKLMTEIPDIFKTLYYDKIYKSKYIFWSERVISNKIYRNNIINYNLSIWIMCWFVYLSISDILSLFYFIA